VIDIENITEMFPRWHEICKCLKVQEPRVTAAPGWQSAQEPEKHMAGDSELMNLLLIENRSSNVRLVRKSLESSKTRCRLQTVGAGADTMNYLRRVAPYGEAPTPDLVLFDLSDIRSESTSLLEQIKADARTSSIPVVLLIDAESEDVVQTLCADRRDRTMFSPIDLDSFFKAMNSFRPDRFLNAVKLIESLGFVLVTLPKAAAASSDLPSATSRDAQHSSHL
jgi:CheY-like chemotaxis protein